MWDFGSRLIEASKCLTPLCIRSGIPHVQDFAARDCIIQPQVVSIPAELQEVLLDPWKAQIPSTDVVEVESQYSGNYHADTNKEQG